MMGGAASALCGLLATKHSKDVFVPQCKTGPTMMAGGLQILDAWAMKKSWANPETYGYEIKASRADFLRDDKWRGYLPYCSQFYFVCPPGVIEPDELPPEVGLLMSSTNIKRLFTKRKATTRDVEIPEELFRYILMWRSEIVSERVDESDLDYWQRWLEEKREKRSIGHRVSRSLRDLVTERVESVKRENERLRRKIESYGRIEKLLEVLEIDPGGWNAEAAVERRVKELNGAVPKDLMLHIDKTSESLEELKKRLGEQ